MKPIDSEHGEVGTEPVPVRGVLDYAMPLRRRLTASPASVSAALCVIGAGIISLAGALMVGLGAIAAANCVTGRESMNYGGIVLAVAAGVLLIGLVRWFRY